MDSVGTPVFSTNSALHVRLAGDAPPVEAWKKVYDYDGSGNCIYEGWAAPGTATSAAKWAIIKRTYSGTSVTVEQWAGGATTAVNIWDNRASLSYS